MIARTEAPTPDLVTQQVADSLALMIIEWVETGIKLDTNWRNGMAGIIARRMARLDQAEGRCQTELGAAKSTLTRLGYTYHGGQLWKPPLGKPPRFDLIDALQSELAKARESIQVRNLGRYGAAYDAPEDKRAYTYEAQPDNVGASRIGGALFRTPLGPDSTDNGLSLLKALQDAGYGVFELAYQSAPTAVSQQHPASAEQRNATIDIEAAAKTLAACMDYPWEHMPEQGRTSMREHAKKIVGAAIKPTESGAIDE